MRTWPWEAIRLMPLLRRAFDGPDLAHAWLYESHPEALGGRTPLECLKTDDGSAVASLLEFMLAGM